MSISGKQIYAPKAFCYFQPLPYIFILQNARKSSKILTSLIDILEVFARLPNPGIYISSLLRPPEAHTGHYSLCMNTDVYAISLSKILIIISNLLLFISSYVILEKIKDIYVLLKDTLS
ncbi:hypothetical protein BDA99DRAFT_531468 [Phascolomyces articulosus]|uniref:Uncharacterized protein n=1 Tax=Phascolomyces articulosus TaxID=60185 RepID=A0AAD5KS12_9FUNG|nr:hypothetical protein BDA99DRAFT_531468 [Phascolomyces articulosus]